MGYIRLRDWFMERIAARLPADLVWFVGLRLMDHARKHKDSATVTLSDALIMWLNDNVRGHTDSRF